MDNTYDKMFYEEGKYIGGVDESGVVDIAGPIIAACVVLPKIDLKKHDLRIFDIDDSKKVHEKYRKLHAEIIWQTAIAIGIGEVSAPEIDFLGKAISCRTAMLRAVSACKRVSNDRKFKPDFLIVDGERALQCNILQHPVKDGDKKSLCTASASIVAKVYRDDIMVKLHSRFPQYGWKNNKGYPCEKQFKGIDKCGAIIGVHRIKYWPFIINSKYPEKISTWKQRRKKWRLTTENAMGQELGGVWKDRPVIKKMSP